MKTPAARALAVGIGSAGLLGWLHVLGVGLPMLLAMAVLLLIVPWIAASWLGDISQAVRGRFWRPEMGSFHSAVRVFNQDGVMVMSMKSIGLIRVRGS